MELRFEYEPTGRPDIRQRKGAPCWVQLYINGTLVGQADFPVTVPLNMGLTGGLTVGRNGGSPVSSRYQAPFAFTSVIKSVIVDVSGDLMEDREAQMKATMAHQ